MDDVYLNHLIINIDNLCNRFPRHMIILTGDFNLPMIDWSIPKLKSNDKITVDILECFLHNAFKQIVNKPTRNNNILDLVLCRNIDTLPKIQIIPPIIYSNHEFLQFNIYIEIVSNRS